MTVCAQANYSSCDLNRDGLVNVHDAQFAINQVSGTGTPAADLSGDGVVNILDVQIEINAILYGYPFYSVTPRFAITVVSLVNQGWIPSDIPSPGNLAIRAAEVQPVSLVNQGWISADIPSAGNLTVHWTDASPVSLINQAWISADIPSAGNLAYHMADALPVTLVNQAWISADIPSPGDVRFVAGLLVSVNNNAVGVTSASQGYKILAGGSSSVPVDLASVRDGDTMLAGQTIRFRVFPPQQGFQSSDFLLNGAPLAQHGPLEFLFTAPANVPVFDLQAVVYLPDGRVWRTPSRRLLIVPDSTPSVDGQAIRADGAPAPSASIAVRTSGLTAEYFRADREASWADLNRTPDTRGYITAVNFPGSPVFGADPFGAGIDAAYLTRFRGEILAAQDGPHTFFLNVPLGARLIVDDNSVVDSPPGVFSPELEATLTLKAGWHAIEIDSYQSAPRASLQLSWQEPNSEREVVRPEVFASNSDALAVATADGSFRVSSLPSILTQIAWQTVPLDTQVHVVLRPIQ